MPHVKPFAYIPSHKVYIKYIYSANSTTFTPSFFSCKHNVLH